MRTRRALSRLLQLLQQLVVVVRSAGATLTLTGIMRKLFERIVMVRLIEYVIECGLISSMSIAGLKGKSDIDALNVLTSDVYRGWDCRVATYAVLMDVKSCYPSIQHDVLVFSLERYYCISGPILTLLADLLQNT